MGLLSSLFILSALFSFVVGIPATQLERRAKTPSVFNNCAGNAQPKLPNQIDSASGYAPQLPLKGEGWEEWVMVVEGLVNGTENPLFFARWSRGDPADPHSKLEDATFAFWTNFENGTTWAFLANGTMDYTDVQGVKTWAIGDIKLAFDGNTGSWNHSIVRPGFSFQSHIDIPPPGTPFTPVMGGKDGLLRDKLHARVEVPRGHITGSVTFPWGESYPELKGMVTIKHLWSRKPIYESLDSYVRGVTYLPEEPSVQTVNWYSTFKDGKQIDASQYLKQTGSYNLGELSVLFQFTDSPSDLNVKTDTGLNSVVTFPGCPEQGGTPNITWTTSFLRTRRSFRDGSGGVTSYHSVSITANQWFNGSWYPASKTGIGFVETYQGPQLMV